MQLCDAFDLPIVTLCDTPGMMVGPDVEETGLVRHCNRLFVTGANVTVPTVTIVLRKAYGLGAQAMMGGSTKAPLACVAWPTGEFGGMGLEGAVRLGYRRELDAVEDDEAREELFQELVERMYDVGKGLSVASYFEIDDVIDPADSRRWITTILDAAPPPEPASRQEATEHRHLVSAAAYIGVAVVVAVAATVQLSAGFGFGLAAVPLLSIVLDPHDAVVVALGLATLTNRYQALTGRHDADRPRDRPAAGRGRRRAAGRTARLPPGRQPGARHRHRCRGAGRRRAHRRRTRPAPRRPGPRRRRRGAVRRADHVGRCQRPATGVRAAGAPLPAGPLPGDDHHGLRGARHRQHRRVRRDRRRRWRGAHGDRRVAARLWPRSLRRRLAATPPRPAPLPPARPRPADGRRDLGDRRRRSRERLGADPSASGSNLRRERARAPCESGLRPDWPSGRGGAVAQPPNIVSHCSLFVGR